MPNRGCPDVSSLSLRCTDTRSRCYPSSYRLHHTRRVASAFWNIIISDSVTEAQRRASQGNLSLSEGRLEEYRHLFVCFNFQWSDLILYIPRSAQKSSLVQGAYVHESGPGVRGRLIDLCEPTQWRYETAIFVILGRNIDSVVVDEEYHRLHRGAPFTILFDSARCANMLHSTLVYAQPVCGSGDIYSARYDSSKTDQRQVPSVCEGCASSG